MGLPLKERSRRYRLVRDQMCQEGLAGLIIFSNAQINHQGLVRYFSNLPIPIYDHALVFLPDDQPFLFTPSPLQTFWAKKRSWIPKSRIKLSREFGKEMAQLVMKRVKRKKTWGVINLNTMAAKDYIAFKSLCPNVNLIDGTGLLENIRSQKSEQELKFVQQSAELAQISHRTIRREMKRGIREEELVSEVEKVLRGNGAERTFYLISSNPNNIFPYSPGPNALDGKSPILFSTEVSGPEGYWTQMVRTFFWRKPKGILMDMYKALKEIREEAEKELRPGRRISDVAKNLKKLIEERNFNFGVHFGHGLGLDVVEEPLISITNDRLLMPNQVVTIHPHLVLEKKSLGIWIGDTYLIRENETKNLTPFLPDDF